MPRLLFVLLLLMLPASVAAQATDFLTLQLGLTDATGVDLCRMHPPRSSTPEGALVGAPCDTVRQTNGAAGLVFWIKDGGTGTDNSGWVNFVAGASINPTTTDITIGAGLQIRFDNLEGTVTDPALCFDDEGGACDTGIFQSATNLIDFSIGGIARFRMSIAGYVIQANGGLALDTSGGAGDVFLRIDAADIFAQRNGTNAQTFRLYETFTDASNNQGLSIDAGVTTVDEVTITPFENGTGADDIDLVLASIGTTGDVRLDTSNDIIFQRDGDGGIRFVPSVGSNWIELGVWNANGGATRTAGTQTAYTFDTTFAPASGTVTDRLFHLRPTLNWGGTPGAGHYEAFSIDVIETAIPTGVNYLIRGQVDSSDIWSVTSTGDNVFATTTGQIKFPTLSGSTTDPSICFEDAGAVCDSGFNQDVVNRISVSLAGDQEYVFQNGSGFILGQGNRLGFDSSNGNGDIFLERDSSDTLALVRTTNAQTFYIYGTADAASSPTNFERLFFRGDGSNDFIIGTEDGGTGATTSLEIHEDGTVMIRLAGNAISMQHDLTFAADQDIGHTSIALGPRSVHLIGPKITEGSGTGVTTNVDAEVRRVTYKITVLQSQWIAAATTADFTIATLPAKTRIFEIIADVTEQFACTAVCTSTTLDMTVGKTAGAAEYLDSFDVDAATAQFGIVDAERGSALQGIINGEIASWGSTQDVIARLTSGTGNIGDGASTNLSGGDITFYITTEVLP